jgi:hypothetical protein
MVRYIIKAWARERFVMENKLENNRNFARVEIGGEV